MHCGTRSGQVDGGGGLDGWLATGLATLVDDGAGGADDDGGDCAEYDG
jgi:hypothetical protein